ncbi:MAG: hypothetical protein ABSA97_07400 [Verrucomicrobiia bacterium]
MRKRLIVSFFLLLAVLCLAMSRTWFPTHLAILTTAPVCTLDVAGFGSTVVNGDYSRPLVSDYHETYTMTTAALTNRIIWDIRDTPPWWMVEAWDGSSWELLYYNTNDNPTVGIWVQEYGTPPVGTITGCFPGQPASNCTLVVYGFGEGSGFFVYSGEWEGSHSYTGPAYALFRPSAGTWAGYWIIASNIDESPDNIYYDCISDNPTTGPWYEVEGAGPGTVSGCYP